MFVQQAELPLAQTIERVRSLNPYIRVQLGEPDEPGWITPMMLLTPGSAHLEAVIAAVQQQLRTTAPNIVGSGVLQAYYWQLMITAVASYLLDGRIPHLGLENMWLRFNATRLEALALRTSRFTALATTTTGRHPDMALVADQAALRTVLRSELEEHFGVVIDQLGRRLGCHAQGLWLVVADRLAGMLIWLMQHIDTSVTPATVEQELELLIRAPGSRLNHRKVGLFTLTCAGRTQAFLNRATCCYWYKMEDGDYCTTCPRRTREDRNQRLLDYMAESNTGGA